MFCLLAIINTLTLVLSQEIVWKWDYMRQRAGLRIQEEAVDAVGKVDPAKAGKILQKSADAFSPENGAREGVVIG
ncbi:hypothetical protein DDT52_20605 [Brenneria roseae subsp. roseae]|uniref:hypothetical protein n=1 Tax=Brenneria roseae TaxID=1509241 RepID=UPI000D60C2AB|nr:hypothetical protein [Brenneria roseae]PWC14603.1 hypothetical protein DDT52_20605 [Brenneria roseae subsp. roseae]